MKCPEISDASRKNVVNNTHHSHTMHNVDFSEYMWMGEELEEFDRKVEEEFWEEAFIEACFEEMLADEETQQSQWYNNMPNHNTNTNNSSTSLIDSFQDMTVTQQTSIFQSKLNPDAPEFVPRINNTSCQQER